MTTFVAQKMWDIMSIVGTCEARFASRGPGGVGRPIYTILLGFLGVRGPGGIPGGHGGLETQKTPYPLGPRSPPGRWVGPTWNRYEGQTQGPLDTSSKGREARRQEVQLARPGIGNKGTV